MSAREELFEKLTDGGWRLAPGEAESVNGLLDAYRTEVLREAAEKIAADAERSDEVRRTEILSGVAYLLRVSAETSSYTP